MTRARILTARFRSVCPACQQAIVRGASIRWTRGAPAVHEHCGTANGPEGIDVIQIGDQTFTRNRRGRCEDAPCCGCCTI